MAHKLKVIPLGGLLEIGKNLTVIEYGNDIVIIDAGLAFPDEEMLGVDMVIPDFTYLRTSKKKVRALILTHGHEDHIGAIPYLMTEVNCPIFCTPLTAGLVELKLAEHKMLSLCKINRVRPGDRVDIGCFNVEFIHTNHSIPDAVALAITTPLGVIFHTGDFKIDTTPYQGGMADLARIGELGKQGVLLLMSDSTNVEREGSTMSELRVGESIGALFKGCDKRIIIATFASNVSRIQQIIDVAVKNGRKVAVSGRSMNNILNLSRELGYINVPDETLVDISAINRYPRNKVCIISTGSQGEPMSALHRMAFSSHKQVEISEGDRVILSASPIPGNEKSVSRLINELFRLGAEVVYERLAEVHTSGHACQNELKMMLSLTRPQYFMPVHGEYRHLRAHANLAVTCGVPQKNVFISENGRILEFSKGAPPKLRGTVPSGQVLVDGLGVGDIGSVVLRDRKLLSEEGLIVIAVTFSSEDGSVIAGPDAVSRGFIYVKEADELMAEIRRETLSIIETCRSRGQTDWASMRNAIRRGISDSLYRDTMRTPVILPIFMEA